MKIDWDRVIQSSVGFGFNILNVKSPRFPKFTIWLGNLAMLAGSWAYWVGLRIGPGSLILCFLVVRRTHVMIAEMPISRRLAIAGAGALLTGLMDVFQQLFPYTQDKPEEGNRTLDELKDQIEKSLKDQVA